MKALVLDASKRTGTIEDIPAPIPSSNELLIKVKAIALNPVDALYAAHPLGKTGRILGSDFSGIVVSLGSSIPASSKVEVGSHVAGFLQGAYSKNDRPGAFAEFLVCPWDLVWRIGDLSFEQAATVSLCALTAAQVLFYRLGIPAPSSFPSSNQEQRKHDSDSSPISIFINGATTSVGLYAAQLARHAPCTMTIIGSASPKYFLMLRQPPYQYDHIVDYRSSDMAQQVLSATNSRGVDVAYDCISEGSSVLNTNKTLDKTQPSTRTGAMGRMAVMRHREGGAWDTPLSELSGIEPIYGAVWEGLGADVEYVGGHLPANHERRAFSVWFYQWLSEERSLMPNSVRVMPSGLERVVEDGFRLLGTGSMEDRRPKEDEDWMRPVSAEKLVYVVG